MCPPNSSAGRYAASIGALGEGIRLLQLSIRRSARNWNAYQLLASTLIKLERFDEAESILRGLLKRRVQTARAHFNLACVHSRRAQLLASSKDGSHRTHLQKSLKHLERALALRLIPYLKRYARRSDPVGDILADPDLRYAAHAYKPIAEVLQRLSETEGSHPERLIYGGTGGCFAGRTSVSTPAGYVPVSRLALGDEVSSRDEHGRPTCSVVVRVICARATSGVTINDRLTVTDRQPIATTTGWKAASVVEMGQSLLSEDGLTNEVSKVSAWEGVREVWQLGLQGHPVFYAEDILVHNAKD